ncbi:MAG TPA: substrate-binding domain-containing protein [Anaerolineales bacterium]
MEPLRRIHKFEDLKILSDSRRLTILQMLMSSPETLSSLGKALGEYPAQVRHHVKKLEEAGLVELVATRLVRGFVEKYYRATAGAFFFHELLLPITPSGQKNTLVVLGSHDLALERLAEQAVQAKPDLRVLALPIGSLEGLVALRQGSAQMAGCHLLDAETGEYNLPYVRHFFPDRPVVLFTLAHREQGLLVAPGNPRYIRSLQDLERPDVRLINRNPGSGTRLWLDRQLRSLGLIPQQILGYDSEVRTHTAVAEMILQGKADVGIGLQAAAANFGLDFIPLFQERYDLVLPQEHVESSASQILFEQLNSKQFRQAANNLGGYDTSHTGERLLP